MAEDLERIDPLTRAPVVAGDRPTMFFALQWNKLVALAKSAKKTALEAAAAAAQAAIANSGVAALNARNIFTGTGLTGGGNLSADRTLSIAATGVTPGSYTSADITVNAQGQITAAANGSGGGGGDFVQISAQTLSSPASTVTFSSIPNTYRALKLLVLARGSASAGAVQLFMQLNTDTGSNYEYRRENQFGASASGSDTRIDVGAIPAANTTPAEYAGVSEATIFGYAATTFYKAGRAIGALRDTGNPFFPENTAFLWRATAAITQIDLFPSSGDFVAGSQFILYGLK